MPSTPNSSPCRIRSRSPPCRPGSTGPFFSTRDPKGGIRRRCKSRHAGAATITVARLGEKKYRLPAEGPPAGLKKITPRPTWWSQDGPARLELGSLAKELGILDRVRFTGLLHDRADVIKAYATADVFVFASRTDTQCLTMLEAAAAGLPLVAIQDRPLVTALTDGVNGYFVAGENEVAFARKVGRILSDRKLTRTAGAASRRRARKQSARARAKQLVNVYDQAIATEQTLPVRTP